MTTQDPFSKEATESRRRLRTIKQNLGPFAEFVQRDPEGFASFAEETADQLGRDAGFENGANIADPEVFSAFIGQSAAQFEQTTGQPSPLRGTGGRRVQRREGEGLGFNLEAALLPAEFIAGPLGFLGAAAGATAGESLGGPIGGAVGGLAAGGRIGLARGGAQSALRLGALGGVAGAGLGAGLETLGVSPETAGSLLGGIGVGGAADITGTGAAAGNITEFGRAITRGPGQQSLGRPVLGAARGALLREGGEVPGGPEGVREGLSAGIGGALNRVRPQRTVSAFADAADDVTGAARQADEALTPQGAVEKQLDEVARGQGEQVQQQARVAGVGDIDRAVQDAAGLTRAERILATSSPTKAAEVSIARQLRETKPLSPDEIKAARAAEQKSRFGQFSGALESGTGQGAFASARSKLAGVLPNPRFKAPTITSENIHLLTEQIRLSSLRMLEKGRANDGFVKILKGETPQRRELELLREAGLGEMVEAFLNRPQSVRQQTPGFILDALTLPKTLLSAFDLSFPFRQGFLLGARNPKQFGAAFRDMFKAFSPEKARLINEELAIKARRLGLIGREGAKHELFVPDVEGSLGTIGQISPREEAFISRFADKIPGIRLSQRTFNTFGNKLKMDVGEKAIQLRQQQGLPVDDAFLDAESNFLNIFTGRGTLGKAEPVADQLNILFWSPRLIAARVQAPTQLLDPLVRRQAAENMAASFGLGMSILAIVKASDLGDVELDPRSSDFGQIRIGRTRINFWAGFQPIARYMAQVVTNQSKNRETGEVGTTQQNRADRIFGFGRSKLAPGVPAIIANELFGRTFIGEDIGGERSDKGRLPDPGFLPLDTIADELGINNVREVEAFKQIVPLFGLDLIDAIDEYGFAKGGALGTLPLFGVGTQTFNEPREGTVDLSNRAREQRRQEIFNP